jgi:hypothetical protein
MEIKEIKKLEKNLPKFICDVCDFKCYQKSDWNRHLMRAKHLNSVNGNVQEILETKKLEKNGKGSYSCECGKIFKTNSGLWKHSKICENKQSTNIILNQEPTDKQLIMLLIKENSELRKEQSDIKELILEIVKNGTHNTTNNAITNNTNSHNKAFNLNFFLNETCKNAMNITDFVDSIKLQLSDFMNIGEVGFVEGISNIIVKNLNSLDETVRPIHCTDQKRETFYIKDENIWEKEEEDRNRLKKMIKSVAYKNEKLMKSYKENYPDYNDPESKRSDQYSKMVIEAMDSKEENREKIIKNISKATTIKSKP